ncbi:MAG: BCCT family betaine/carnitine transporter [Gammaproteobacteria bacterium]|jgi:BCCT family betaine/carnitine transporter
MNQNRQKANIDWFIFITTTCLVIGVCIPLVLAPKWGANIVNFAFEFITQKFGILYIWSSLATMIFLLWLALGPHGKIRLGNTNDKPNYSMFSWASMIFCAGIGSALIYWATIEWTYYFSNPPFGIESGTEQATIWAASYGLFHWGPSGWAFYCLPAVALSYAYHVRGIPYLRISAACEAVLGQHSVGAIGKCIDILVMFGLIGAAATSLGFSTPMISTAMSEFLGLEESFSMTVVILILSIVLFATSVYIGLDKGIKRLSNINSIIALLLAALVLLLGPTAFILKMGTNSIGHVIQNYIKMNTWTDPITQSGFVENWTIFYWAWWLGLGPFVGIFVTKISRGRTIRELIFGMLGFGALGCAIFFIILGNYALHLQLESTLDVVALVKEQGAPLAISKVILSLPFGYWILPIISVIALIFTATTYDSASYTLASCATKNLPVNMHPARWHRIFWACALGVLPISLLFLGGLNTLQTMSIVVSLPLIFVFILMATSLLLSLRESEVSPEPENSNE